MQFTFAGQSQPRIDGLKFNPLAQYFTTPPQLEHSINAEQSVGWGYVPAPFESQNASKSAGGSVGPAGVVDFVVGGFVVVFDVVALEVVDCVVALGRVCNVPQFYIFFSGAEIKMFLIRHVSRGKMRFVEKEVAKMTARQFCAIKFFLCFRIV